MIRALGRKYLRKQIFGLSLFGFKNPATMNIIGGPPPPRDKRGRIIPIPDISGAIVHNVPGDRHTINWLGRRVLLHEIIVFK